MTPKITNSEKTNIVIKPSGAVTFFNFKLIADQWQIIKVLILLLMILTASNTSYSQASYQSRATGDWNSSSVWELAPGSPVDAQTPGTPDGNDNVIIRDGHTITANINSICSNLTIYSLGVLNIENINFTVNGPSNIFGTLNDIQAKITWFLDPNPDVNSFGGKVTINSGGYLLTTENSEFVFSAGIENNGTLTLSGDGDLDFRSGTINNGTFTLSGDGDIDFRDGIENNSYFTSSGDGIIRLRNDQIISGNAAMVIGNDVIISNGVIVTNSNTSTVTINGRLNGGNTSSTWLNNSGSTLFYGNTNRPMSTGTFDVDANPNTVNYTSGGQTISNTTYHNLVTSGSGTKALNGDVTVNGNLTIGSGTILDVTNNDRSIALRGNWINNGTFTQRNGEVRFTHTSANQQISGTTITTFYDLRLVKATGFNIILNTNVLLQRNLNFENNGHIVLGTSSFTFLDGSSYTSAGVGRMFQQTGTVGGGEVIKVGNNTNSNSTDFTFTFPVGTNNDYTPVQFTSLYQTPGVNNVNRYVSAKTILIPSGGNNLVNRYFLIDTDIPTIANYDVTFNYVQGDEVGVPTDVIRKEGVNENVIAGAVINLTNNTFRATGSGSIESEWYLKRQGPPTYFSYQTGLWSSPNTWTTDPTGNTLVGSPASGGPNNSENVVILAGRTVTMDQNSKTLESTVINSGGKLDVASTTGHNLGTVTGVGTLALSAVSGGTTTFPSGTFNSFLAPAGTGTIEYNGTVGYTIGTAPLAYYHLIVAGNSTKTLSSTVSITGDLTINASATFSSGSNAINLNGNLINNGTFAGTGQFNFTNTSIDQQISGSAITAFNNLNLVKGGRNLVLNASARVNGILSFTNSGYIVLGTNNFIFGPNGSVSVTAPAGTGRMIQQTGSTSGGSVIKEGNSASDLLFTFPIGTGADYAPAQITSLTATITSPGQVGVKAITSPPFINDIVNRYFSVYTTNIGSITDAGLTFNYVQADEAGSPSSVLRKAGGTSTVATGGFRNLSSNVFGTNPALANTVLASDWYLETPGPREYYSYQSGNWTNPTTWTLDPTGVTLVGSPATGGPLNIDKVTILSGRTVAMDASSKTVSSTTINTGGILNVGATTGQDLGSVSGAGTLQISALNGETTVFPGGDFTNFLANAGTGTVEYNGTNSYYIGTSPLPYHHIIFSGGSTKTVTELETTIAGNLTIASSTTFVGNGKNFHLGGDWINNGTFGYGAFPLGEVNFNNTTVDQYIRGTSTTRFFNLRMSKASGKNLILNRNVYLKGNLYFTNPGYIVLSTYNFVFEDGATVAAEAPGGTGKMIQQTGTTAGGAVIKEGSAANGTNELVFTFPIGTGSVYTPAQITSLSATLTGTANVAVKTILIPPGGTKIINRYFSVTTNGISAIADVGLTFKFDDSDEVGAPNQVRRSVGGIFYSVTGYFYNLVSNSFGTNINGGNTFLESDWYLDRPSTPQDYYSYQSGSWSDPNTWTTDPTGATLINSPNSGGPNNLDNVTILPGTTVLIDQNAKMLAGVAVQNGGILNIAATTGHDFGTVAGQGTIQISSANIPAGNFSSFVSAAGGTIEYNNPANFNLPTALSTYNNLTINLSSDSYIATQKQSLVLNGNLVITRGEFRINDAIDVYPNPYTLTINKNVEVASAGKISIGTGRTHNQGTTNVNGTYSSYNNYNNMFHRIYIYGDLTNNGVIRLTNQTAPIYNQNADPAASVFFTGPSNNTATLNNTTDFYNLIIDKGSDRTFVFTVNASNEANFRLFGRNNLPGRGNTGGSKDPNPEIRKALWIKNGTLRLTGQILIPTLTEGTGNGPTPDTDPNGDYHIPSNGALWIDGAGVSVYSTADNNAQTTVGGATGSGVDTGESWQAWSVYGLLKVTSGYFDSRSSAGLIFWSTGSDAKMEINGGTVRLTQIRAGDSNGKVSYVQTGGELYLEGASYGEESIGSGVLGFNAASHVFIMSGGDIYINDLSNTNNGSDISQNAIQIGSSSANYSVTGGTITMNLKGARNYGINSTANLHNLIINRTANTNTVQLSIHPLRLTGNLTINTNTTLECRDFDVSIKGNFINNGTYIPGTNTTTFNGTENSQELQSNTTTSFNNLVLNNTFPGGALTLAGTVNPKTTTIGGDLTLTSGNLNDGGFTLNVTGNVSNSVVHSGAGKIRMTSGASRAISGNGNGVFGNLEINNSNAAGVVASSDLSITGTLTLTAGILNISIYNLSLGELATISVGTPSATRMIKLAGNRNDGGISKKFTSTTGTFTFPIGTNSDYTPAQTNVASASTYGTVTVRPVALQHPFIAASQVSNALTYYWRVSETGFSDVTTATHTFRYEDGDILGTEANYVAGRYSQTDYGWDTGSPVTTGSNQFSYTISSLIEGEYTAGILAAFGGVTVFQSRITGGWESATTWDRYIDGVLQAATATIPGARNPVKILDNHTVTVNTTTPAISGSLEIQTLGVLDLGTTISSVDHNFGALVGETVTGNGKLRISATGTAPLTARFPSGDFGNFIRANGGTVEYYITNNASFTLPILSISGLQLISYNNLIITPATTDNNARSITLPNTNLTVYNDLTIQSSGAGAGATSVLTNTATAGGAKTLTVRRDINVANKGILNFNNGNVWNINVGRDVNIATGGTFGVVNLNTTVANMLTISGSLVNNGSFDLLNTRYANVTFNGSTNATISGTGAITEFNRLIVNKGTGQSTILEVTSSNFLLGYVATNNGATKALELQNGTFKYSRTSITPVEISTGNSTANDFNIPSTARLWVNSGALSINSTGTKAGMILGGKLQVSGGSMSVAGGGTNDNYIEVSGAGNPEIEISGGSLTVGSQIRRSIDAATGSLKYSQSGGTVTVGTQSAGSPNRGMFEVLNTASSFSMSSGDLIISRSNGSASAPSLELSPDSHSITGGTVTIGGATTPGTILIDTEIPLYHFNVVTTGSPVAKLSVHGLTTLGNLTINTGATLNANNLNVAIRGNFVNNATYTPGTNTTSFTGNLNNQTLGGTTATTFNNLTIANTFSGGTVSLGASNITINGNTVINSGTIEDNGRIITVKGNIYNAATHSSNGSGKMVLSGTSEQIIDGNGNGAFGNIDVNNSLNVRAIAAFRINKTLNFNSGLLNIDGYLLTFGPNGNYSGTVSATKMILTNGMISDAGIRKMFSAGSFNFTFPVGVSGKYTPAKYIASANTASGSITLKPINTAHPSTTTPGNTELNYYWNVVSTGFANLKVEHHYHYNQADANGNGNELTYTPARFVATPSPAWSYGSTLGKMIPAKDSIIIQGSGGVNFITGDYTAGEITEFGSLNPYSSNGTGGGLWDSPSSWAGNEVPQVGSPVTIRSGDVVTIPTNNVRIHSLVLSANAKLIINNTNSHYFGTVTGTGTIVSSSGNFPLGQWDAFNTAGGGTVEFVASTAGSYTLPNLLQYNNLVINTDYPLSMSSNNVTVHNDFTIKKGALHNSNNRPLTIEGDWWNNGTFVAGTGAVTFSGVGTQIIRGKSKTDFGTLIISKTSGNIQLDTITSIIVGLQLNNGKIITSSSTDKVVFHDNAVSTPGNANSFIDGLVTKIGDDVFTFPVGDGNIWSRLKMYDFYAFAANTEFSCQYFATSPSNRQAFDNTKLERVSGMEYWNLSRVSDTGNDAACKVELYWEDSERSGISDMMNPVNKTDLTIAHYSSVTNVWENMGGGAVMAGSGGNIASAVRLHDFSPITFGSDPDVLGNQTNPLPLVFEKLILKKIDETSVDITWKVRDLESGSFKVERSADGISFESIYTIELQDFNTYTFSVVDDNALSGTSYYRIRFESLTDTVYSQIESIKDGESGSIFVDRVYPNPNKGEEIFFSTNLVNETLSIRIIDLKGYSVLNPVSITTDSDGLGKVSDLDLKQGFYIISITKGVFTFKQKIIIE